jgi:hypothetical protein
LFVPVVHGSTNGGDEMTYWPTVIMTDTDWRLVRRAIDKAIADGSLPQKWQVNVLSKLSGRIDQVLVSK